MKKLILLLFLLLNISYITAQEIQILSKQTQKPIPFATVTYIENDSIVGIFPTDEEGKIKLDIPKNIKLIRVYATNYHTEEIETDKIPNKFFLDDDFIHLDEVVVTSQKKKIKNLGFASKRTNSNFIFTSGQEATTLIQNPYNKNKKIKSLLFVLSRRNQNLDVLFKFHFYKNKNNQPDEAYAIKEKSNIFTLKKGKRRKQKIELNIQDLGIVLPKEGLFVGIEYIGKVDEKTKEIIPQFMRSKNDFYSNTELETGVFYIKTKKIIYTYRRYNISNIHKKLKEWNEYDRGFRFFDETEKDTYYTPAIGIEVFE